MAPPLHLLHSIPLSLSLSSFSFFLSLNTSFFILLLILAMAACGSLRHMFETPLPENPSFLESLARNQIKPVKPIIEQSSFTEIFGELHFKDTSVSSSFSSCFKSPPVSIDFSSVPTNEKDNFNHSNTIKTNYSGCHRKGDIFSSKKWESLQLCTEGLGSESSDDVEDLHVEMNEQWPNREEKVNITKHFQPRSLSCESRRARTGRGSFPPPISCIGKSGKPWVSFKSYRHDGRFVLKEIRKPTQELLQACREDGRLKLQFQPNQEIQEDGEEDDEDETEENGVDNDDDNGRTEQ